MDYKELEIRVSAKLQDKEVKQLIDTGARIIDEIREFESTLDKSEISLANKELRKICSKLSKKVGAEITVSEFAGLANR